MLSVGKENKDTLWRPNNDFISRSARQRRDIEIHVAVDLDDPTRTDYEKQVTKNTRGALLTSPFSLSLFLLFALPSLGSVATLKNGNLHQRMEFVGAL